MADDGTVRLHNPLTRPMRVTEVKVNGVSALAAVRAALLATGRLEDPEDDLTLLPGETLIVGNADEPLTGLVELVVDRGVMREAPAPDFDQIALVIATTRLTARDLAEQLRLIWNARGAADLVATLDDARTYMTGSVDVGLMATLRRAIRTLDR